MSEIKLYNGDCLSVLPTLRDESIDLIVTDPPYRITEGGYCGTGGMLHHTKKLSMQGKVFEHNDIDCSEYAPEFYRVLKDGSHCYVMCNNINLINMLNTFTDLRTDEEKEEGVKPYGFHFIKSLIWDKCNKIVGRFYMSQFEYILFFRKGRGIKINNCSTSDLISIPNRKTKDDGQNLHDTEKPVELMRILIENSSSENQIVLDPFMGIGSTGIACKQSGRSFIGIEIDKQYFDIATTRINGETRKYKKDVHKLFSI